jgi:hypothetical protein
LAGSVSGTKILNHENIVGEIVKEAVYRQLYRLGAFEIGQLPFTFQFWIVIAASDRKKQNRT